MGRCEQVKRSEHYDDIQEYDDPACAADSEYRNGNLCHDQPPFILMVRAYARAGTTDLALPTFLC